MIVASINISKHSLTIAIANTSYFLTPFGNRCDHMIHFAQ